MSCPFLKDCMKVGPICNVCEVYGPLEDEPTEINHTLMKHIRTKHINSKIAKLKQHKQLKRTSRPSQATYHIKRRNIKEEEDEYLF